ncbi:tripartite tricarboxylate transporter TctB family protein [Saccharopolyspora sp. K220]|uniref:tripartite tricarboxylate transporter TctB family protein n=1 Tax=Saccharopolyspora soli TaxID=2926618 RepID=UPI001F5AD2A8|nr:tripartite tricarboxylate transporter TctB family protein [Saccharopolyspora soli]MCI2418389.1 tripartite tricarboxylate transporter TctB family protein [Saccharopolyspora soli]
MTQAQPTSALRSDTRKTDLVITAVLVLLFGAALLATTAWPFRTALFPTIVSGAALLLSLAHLATLLLRRRRAEPAEQQREAAADGDVDYVFATAGRRAWTAALAWAAAFFVALYVVGLLIAAPLFSFCYLRFAARRSWLFSLVYAAVVLAAIYLAFEFVLTIPIPAAVWEQS